MECVEKALSKGRVFYRKKVGYKTLAEASDACFDMWAKDPSVDIDDLKPYKCPKCPKYHIGHRSYYMRKVKGTQNGRSDNAKVQSRSNHLS